MTMVRDIELVQLLEDAREFVTAAQPSDKLDMPDVDRYVAAQEHLAARLETEIRRRKVL